MISSFPMSLTTIHHCSRVFRSHRREHIPLRGELRSAAKFIYFQTPPKSQIEPLEAFVRGRADGQVSLRPGASGIRQLGSTLPGAGALPNSERQELCFRDVAASAGWPRPPDRTATDIDKTTPPPLTRSRRHPLGCESDDLISATPVYRLCGRKQAGVLRGAQRGEPPSRLPKIRKPEPGGVSGPLSRAEASLCIGASRGSPPAFRKRGWRRRTPRRGWLRSGSRDRPR